MSKKNMTLASANNAQSNTTSNIINNGLLKARSEWSEGDNVFYSNYCERNNFADAPVAAVAIIKVGGVPEYWKKISEYEWAEASQKDFIAVYKEYSDSMFGQIRKDVVEAVKNSVAWLSSDEGMDVIDDSEDYREIYCQHTADWQITIDSSLSDGCLDFSITSKYDYVEGLAQDPMMVDDYYSYPISEIDIDAIIDEITHAVQQMYAEPAYVCEGRRYRSTDGDTYTVTKVTIPYDGFDWYWRVDLKSDELGTELSCIKDRNDDWRWKISWTDTDEYIDFNDNNSLIL